MQVTISEQIQLSDVAHQPSTLKVLFTEDEYVRHPETPLELRVQRYAGIVAGLSGLWNPQSVVFPREENKSLVPDHLEKARQSMR